MQAIQGLVHLSSARSDYNPQIIAKLLVIIKDSIRYRCVCLCVVYFIVPGALPGPMLFVVSVSFTETWTT